MKRVLILQHDWSNPPGSLLEILEERQIASNLVNVECEPIPDPTDYQALIIMGGPQFAPDDAMYPYLAHEKKLLRRAIEHEIPALGICLGGQLLALALDGTVNKHRTHELGFYKVDLTQEGKNDPLFQGLTDFQQVYHWHSDVFSLPDGAVRLATHQNAENQAFRFGKWVYGLQYHIELTPELLDLWLHHPKTRATAIELAGSEALDLIEQERAIAYPIYCTHTRIVFENFLKLTKLW